MAKQDVAELNLYSANLKDWSLHGPTGALIAGGDSFSREGRTSSDAVASFLPFCGRF